MASFAARNDRHLQRTGRANATGASRRAETVEDGAADDLSDILSVATKFSHAPSLHPSSVSGMSEACHPETIGAGDMTQYWDFQHREAQRNDLGHKCRECRMPFTMIGEPITERRGARVSMRYHAECYSGYADPRSQLSSSHHQGTLKGTQLPAAPAGPFAKMRTAAHFEGQRALRSIVESISEEAEAPGNATEGHRSGAIAGRQRDAARGTTFRGGGGGGGKQGGLGLGMGGNGFGAKSSRLVQPLERVAASGAEASDGLTEAQLCAHERSQAATAPASAADTGARDRYLSQDERDSDLFKRRPAAS